MLSKDYDILRLRIVAIEVDLDVTGYLTDVGLPTGAKPSIVSLLLSWNLKLVGGVDFHGLVAVRLYIITVVCYDESLHVLGVSHRSWNEDIGVLDFE